MFGDVLFSCFFFLYTFCLRILLVLLALVSLLNINTNISDKHHLSLIVEWLSLRYLSILPWWPTMENDNEGMSVQTVLQTAVKLIRRHNVKGTMSHILDNMLAYIMYIEGICIRFSFM